MYTPDKCKFITTSQQRILVLCHEKNGLTFGDQSIYRSNRSFKSAMRQLANANIVKIDCIKQNSHFCNKYTLTLNGVLLVEEVILDFINANK